VADNFDSGCVASNVRLDAVKNMVRSNGYWYGTVSTDVAAKYLGKQIALALAQRASGENATAIREILSLALSVFR
jgi:hypothetical protein|tara:strand:- start:208 stop:432 length:225 start_codon:yes stop_codon:yes gene_type:complete